MLKRFIANQRGATGVEYGLIAALIALAVLGALQLTGGNVNSMYESNAEKVSDAIRSVR